MDISVRNEPPMKKTFPVEFVFQVFALLLSFLIVHTVYVTLVRPSAAAVLEEQALQIQENKDYVPERSVYVLIKAFEQESCFILLIWPLAIMSFPSSTVPRVCDIFESSSSKAFSDRFSS